MSSLMHRDIRLLIQPRDEVNMERPYSGTLDAVRFDTLIISYDASEIGDAESFVGSSDTCSCLYSYETKL